MMRFLAACLMILMPLLAPAAYGGAQAEAGKTAIRFETADVLVDSGMEALAAYQVEITYDRNRVRIVGLEGGETDAYREPPFYDPRGMEDGRIIIAAFTTEDGKAPQGRTRVARLHLRITGAGPVTLKILLMTAARPGGEQIRAVPEIVMERNPEWKTEREE